MSKISTIKEMWDFLRQNKKWFLIPLALALLLFGGLMIFAQSSVLGPFVYTLF